jgi:hypothetical protein
MDLLSSLWPFSHFGAPSIPERLFYAAVPALPFSAAPFSIQVVYQLGDKLKHIKHTNP